MGSTSAARTPAKTPSTAKKTAPTGSTGKQSSILGFFSRASGGNAAANSSPLASSQRTPTLKKETSSQCLKESTKTNSIPLSKRPSNITPVPSSDAVEPWSSQENRESSPVKVVSNCLPSRVFLAKTKLEQATPKPTMASSPTRKVCNLSTVVFIVLELMSILQVKKVVSYAESSDEDEDVFASLKTRRTQQRRPRSTIPDDDEDDFETEDNEANGEDDGTHT